MLSSYASDECCSTFVVLVFKPRASVAGSLQHRPISSAVFDRSAAFVSAEHPGVDNQLHT